MTYAVKECFLTLQGEGVHSGRRAVFLRFAGCNLWSGRERDRAQAKCRFCDTDFVGTDGEQGGRYTAADLAARVRETWGEGERPLVVATGAGIGPVLPYLLDGTALECLWIGRDHRGAMGGDLVARVLAGGNVTLIDSSGGRPDIGAHAAARARRFEAVFVVANAGVRDDVARACRSLGVPCYGPTFDS